MLEQLFCVVMRFAQGQGVSPQQAKKVFRSAELRLSNPSYSLGVSPRLTALRQIAALLESWYSEAVFLDAHGWPRPLPIEGPKSFSTLARRHLPNYAPEPLVTMMLAENILSPHGDDLLVPHRRTAAFATPNAMMLERIPALVHGLLSTFAHNTNPRGRCEGTYCERDAWAELPVELLPSFQEVVKAWAQSFLDKTDAWTRRRRRSRGNHAGAGTVRVGVEVFSFVEADHPSRGSSSRPKSP